MRAKPTILMTALCAVVTSARGLQTRPNETVDRILSSQTLQCPYASAVVFFELSTTIDPSSTNQTCSNTQKTQIALYINNRLLELGLTNSTGTEATFLAGVCPTSSLNIRRNLQMGGNSFTYTGGGACRFCKSDNGDGRSRSLRSSMFMPAPASPNEVEFNSNVAPSIADDLESVLTTDLSTEFSCVGTSPSITATVQSKSVLSLAASIQCLDVNILGSI